MSDTKSEIEAIPPSPNPASGPAPIPDAEEVPAEAAPRAEDERDFTGNGLLGLKTIKGSTGDGSIDGRIAELVADWGCEGKEDLIEEMVITALKIGRDHLASGDLKLINRSLKEMRAAARVFAPYNLQRKVACYGSARTQPDQPEYKVAEEFARKMRDRGFWAITGAGDGIMGAANKGSGRDSSFGLNIRLPFEQSANPTIIGDPKLINFNYFFTRKLAFVKESHAAALFPGGFGTMDECFEVLTLMQTGKAILFPVVMVDAPGGSYWKTFNNFLREHLLRLGLISADDFNLFKITDNVDEAVEEIINFYRVFHSYRYVRNKMVIRMKKPLSEEALEAINEEFPDLLENGRFVQGKALSQERNEESIAELPRLIFAPHRGKTGRLRLLIDAINRYGAE